MSTSHTAARFLVQLPENSENYKNDQVCKFFNVTSDDAETVVRVEFESESLTCMILACSFSACVVTSLMLICHSSWALGKE